MIANLILWPIIRETVIYLNKICLAIYLKLLKYYLAINVPVYYFKLLLTSSGNQSISFILNYQTALFIFRWLIRFWTKSRICHCQITITSGRSEERPPAIECLLSLLRITSCERKPLIVNGDCTVRTLNHRSLKSLCRVSFLLLCSRDNSDSRVSAASVAFPTAHLLHRVNTHIYAYNKLLRGISCSSLILHTFRSIWRLNRG